MPNKIKIIILGIAILAIIFLIANLVWGKTMRMAKANQLFSKSQIDKAKAIYEDLAVDSPKSPYILHNVGLSYFKQGENDRAVEYFKNSLKEFESTKLNPDRKKAAVNLDYYHLGSAQFQSAAKNSQGPSGGANLYQEALDNFKKAMENNPKDMEAKYNYELTRLRLKSENGQQSQDKKQNQDQKENQKQQEKQADKGEDKNQNQNENKNANPKPTQEKDQMSKEQVEALLKMNENNDQYQTPVIKENNMSPEKNW